MPAIVHRTAEAQNDPAQARFLAKDTRWLRMDDGKDRIVEAQVNITNKTINLSADDRRRRIEELSRQRAMADGA